MKSTGLFPLMTLSLLPMSQSLQAATESKPNVVVILIDDQGWNSQSLRMDSKNPGSGSTYYQTPNMDALAQSGMRFSYAYSSAPTSGPSRNSIQYGRSPSSLGIYAECPPSFLKAENKNAMCRVIKENMPEYTTAHFGKWHVLRTPDQLGYDKHDGDTSNKDGNSLDPDDPKHVFSLSKRANDFMSEQVKEGNPFFLQISYYANHLQFQALASTIKDFETKYAGNATEYQKSALWAAMNKNLDEAIGSVTEQIKALGIDDNTYIIVTGDNGYEDKLDGGCRVEERGYYKAYPLRSHKYLVTEGGLRVPFYISGPGISADQQSKISVVSHDIYPTVMDIIGLKDKMPADVEGGSILPLAQGNSKAVERKEPFLVFRYSKSKSNALDIAIVDGEYKLIKELKREGGNDMHLFNIHKDQGESVNLYDKKRSIADDMYAKMTKYFESVGWDESQAGSIFTSKPKLTKEQIAAKKAKKAAKAGL